MQIAASHGMQKVCDDFHREHQQIMDIFGRSGRKYEFGFAPLLWSSKVWQALDEQFLKPKGMNFYDAIMQFPGEMQWYGEAMLKFHPFPLMPVEPLFKVYHYQRQYNAGLRMYRLANNFLGVCYQSNWEKQIDFVKKPFLSRLIRWIKRNVFRRYR